MTIYPELANDLCVMHAMRGLVAEIENALTLEGNLHIGKSVDRHNIDTNIKIMASILAAMRHARGIANRCDKQPPLVGPNPQMLDNILDAFARLMRGDATLTEVWDIADNIIRKQEKMLVQHCLHNIDLSADDDEEASA